MKSIYEFESILAFLKERVGGKEQRRGIKSSLSKAMGCQSSYLSQVLSGKTKLTLEQGSDAADFFQMSELDKDYFMFLLQKERAGNFKLKEFYQKKLNSILVEKNKLSSRLKDQVGEIPQEAIEKYYSSWLFLAVHILTSIPGFRDAKKIGEHLGVPKEQVEQILQFLVQHSFVELKEQKYFIGSRHIHLEKENPLNFQHQLNWRLRALEKVRSKSSKEINYAGVFSLSKEDAEKIKEDCIKLIKSNLKKVAPSKEEVMYCSIIDFFEV